MEQEKKKVTPEDKYVALKELELDNKIKQAILLNNDLGRMIKEADGDVISIADHESLMRRFDLRGEMNEEYLVRMLKLKLWLQITGAIVITLIAVIITLLINIL